MASKYHPYPCDPRPEISDPAVLVKVEEVERDYLNYRKEKIDKISKKLLKFFRKNTDWAKDPTAREAYRYIFNLLGTRKEFWECVWGRCDKGDRTLGNFAVNLYENREWVLFLRWWSKGGKFWTALILKIDPEKLGYTYEGVEAYGYVLFFAAKTLAPDFAIINVETGEKLLFIEVKDGGKKGQGTFKVSDCKNYIAYSEEYNLPLYVLTFHFDEGHLVYTTLLDVQALRDIIAGVMEDGRIEETSFKCSWLATKSKGVIDANVLRDYEGTFEHLGRTCWARKIINFTDKRDPDDACKILEKRIPIQKRELSLT